MELLLSMNASTLAAAQRSALDRRESVGSFRPFSQIASPRRRDTCSPRMRFAEQVATHTLSRKDFPTDFIFGAGTSAFQVEGAPVSGGRGATIWDSFVHIPGNVSDGRLNYPACDFYNLYEDDIKLAKELGLDAFRFSISWTRIYPRGAGPESPEGIEYYNRVINAVLRAGMTPLVTLFHWEVPQYLENDPEVLGFRTKNIVPYFERLAETCFKHYGDRVKMWVTINEIWTFSLQGFGYGLLAPRRCSSVSGNECLAGDSQTEVYQVGHNLLLAHARVYQLYKNKYKEHQNGKVGYNPIHFGAEPYSTKEEDKLAAQRYLEFTSGWQVDPVVFGDYPKSMRDALGDRLPKFTKEESEELKNSCDFFGNNYYSAFFVKNADVPEDVSERWYVNDPGVTTHVTNEDGTYIGAHTGPSNSIIRNCAAHLPPLLEWLQARYGDIPCYITENGCNDPNSESEAESLADEERITYLRDHLTYISKAIADKGINVKGYFHWSFIDVFEWDSGFKAPLGLIRVHIEDGKPPTRTLKNSAKWYKKFLAA